MHDRPRVSARTRIAQGGAIALIVMQGVLVSTSDMTTWGHAASAVLVASTLILSAAMMAWMASRVHGALAPRRNSALIAIAGGVVRGVALMPLSLQDARLTGGLLDEQHLMWLSLGYALLLTGFALMVADTAHQTSIRLPAVISVGGAVAVYAAFCLAAFGPLPGVPTIMTARDQLALGLLSVDMVLVALATTIALASLSREKGLLSRPWLWVAYGEIVVAMGDSVQPLLSLEDAAFYTGLLWSLGYALVAAGASLLVDVIEWCENRPHATHALLYRPSPRHAPAHGVDVSASDPAAN